MNDFFGQTVTKVFLWFRAEIREWKNCNGGFGRGPHRGRRDVGLNRSFAKYWCVASLRKVDYELVHCAFRRVIFPELCPQTVGIHANDRADTRIESSMPTIISFSSSPGEERVCSTMNSRKRRRRSAFAKVALPSTLRSCERTCSWDDLCLQRPTNGDVLSTRRVWAPGLVFVEI